MFRYLLLAWSLNAYGVICYDAKLLGHRLL